MASCTRQDTNGERSGYSLCLAECHFRSHTVECPMLRLVHTAGERSGLGPHDHLLLTSRRLYSTPFHPTLSRRIMRHNTLRGGQRGERRRSEHSSLRSFASETFLVVLFWFVLFLLCFCFVCIFSSCDHRNNASLRSTNRGKPSARHNTHAGGAGRRRRHRTRRRRRRRSCPPQAPAARRGRRPRVRTARWQCPCSP